MFSRILAQEDEFWGVEFMFWTLGANLENLEFRFHARATTFIFTLPLERQKVGLSINFMLSEICVFRSTLERQDLRSSEELCLTLERASSRDFMQLELFHILQTARAKESTLERPLTFGMSARAKESTLERDPCFSKILAKCFKYIFASSFHPKHS